MKLLHYHRSLFQWHCRNFFRFRRHLLTSEKAYLETCFALAQDFSEVSPSGYRHFSTYSYSHRIAGKLVNSSRLAYGSLVQHAQAWQAAQAVLRQRGLRLDLPEEWLFYGLGWDFLAQEFKVYFRIPELQRLAPSWLALLQGRSLHHHRAEGLISWSYVQGNLQERKLYLYPLEGREAHMLSDRRGFVKQVDVEAAAGWRERLSPEGQRILDLYAQISEELDTIAYSDENHYTLYFP